MTKREKFLFIFLQVITLGLIWIYWKQIKVKQYQSENQLSIAKQISFDCDLLISHLGTITNISQVSASHSKVTINYQQRKLLDLSAIKALKGVSGVFANDRAVTIIVGNQAKLIADEINKQVQKG